MKLRILVATFFVQSVLCFGQVFEGVIVDAETNLPLNGVLVTLIEDSRTDTTGADGVFSITATNNGAKTLTVEFNGYVFEEYRNLNTQSNIQILLRERKKSTATARWEGYLQNCTNYNNPNIPNNQVWNMDFSETELTGDFAQNSFFTRRDPSKVIQVGNKFYAWYTRSISSRSNYFDSDNTDERVFPWDYSDVYYATSTDGYNWKEEGPAVVRGASGSFDDRSVFTPEIFVHEGKYYLVYQAVQDPYIERVKNTVAMATADSPDGPWTKLAEPILRAANNGIWTPGTRSRLQAIKKGDFDSHKVHDPCLIFFKNKFYLYYKGERMGEERYCGQREIRWGVAIADNPEGPYVKSEYNPITNTGHEMIVWPYNDGVAIIQKLDGPERGSVQFAQDGVNFEMMGTTTGQDDLDALGLANPDIHENSPSGGVKWGLAHVLRFDIIPGGWMYIKRFDLIDNRVRTVILDDEEGITIGVDESQTMGYTVFPLSATNKNVTFSSGDTSKVEVNNQGVITGKATGEAVIEIKSQDGDITDAITVKVVSSATLSTDDIKNNSIGVYAAPSNEYIIIEGFGEGKLEVFHYSGILKQKIESFSADRLSINSLPTGLYLLRLTNEKGTHVSKFVKI